MKHDKDWSSLAEQLRRLAAENAAALPPADLEARVMRAVNSAATRPPQRNLFRARAAATVFVVAIAAVLLVIGPAIPRGGQGPNRVQPFIQIPYVAPPAPYERLAVVRRRMPVAALIAAGFKVQAPDAGSILDAEILVGQDGRPLALRPISGTNVTRRRLQP